MEIIHKYLLSHGRRVFALFLLSFLISEYAYADSSRSAVPVITSEFCGQDFYTSVLGTSTEPAGSVIEVYYRNSQSELATTIGSASVLSDGTWRLANIALESGFISATATANGKLESLPSSEVEIQVPISITQGLLSHPTSCGALDGSVELLGLVPFANYEVNYEDESGFQSVTLTSDLVGSINISGLEAGTIHNITVGRNGCLSNTICSVELEEPALPKLTAGVPIQPLVCGGTGSILIVGAPLMVQEYDVSYFDGATTINETITSSIAGIITISDLAAGTYSNFQVSKNGCSAELILDRITIYDGLLPITVTLGGVIPPSSCTAEDGSVELQNLLPLTTYNVYYETEDGVTVSTSISTAVTETSITLTNLGEGVLRNLRVEHLGCTSTPLADINLSSLPDINIGSVTNPLNCLSADGSIEIQGLVGNETYTIEFEVDGVANSISSTANADGEILIDELEAGVYANIYVLQGDCQSNILGDIIELDQIQAPEIDLGLTSLPSACGTSDGEIVLVGLLPGTEYDVSYESLSGLQTKALVTDAVSGHLTIPNLTSGAYNNISVSLNGCTSNTIACTVDLESTFPSISLNAVAPTSVCGAADGAITIGGLEADTNYDISYRDSEGVKIVSDLLSSALGTLTLGNLQADTYSDLSVSFGGCTSEPLQDISLGDEINISIASIIPQTSCGSSDGSMTLSGLEASDSYHVSFTLDGNENSLTLSSVSGLLTIANLEEGVYSNIVVSNGTCESNTISELIPINPPNKPSINLGLAANPSSCGVSDGSISIIGVSPETLYDVEYTSSSGTQVESITSDSLGVLLIDDLAADNYKDFSVNSSGCESDVLFEVVNLYDSGTPPISLGNITSPTVCSAPDGKIEIEGLVPLTDYNVSYTRDGGNHSVSLTSDDNGIIPISNLEAGYYENIRVSNGGCVSASVGPASLQCFEDAVYTVIIKSIDQLSDADTLAYPVDPDGPIAYAEITGGVLLSGTEIDSVNGVIYVAAEAELVIGETTVSIFTIDVKGDTTQQDVTIEILNDTPIANNDSYTVLEGQELVVNDANGSGGDSNLYGVIVNDSDMANSGLTATKLSDPASHSGSFVLNADGTFTYTHDGSESGNDSFTYRLSDGLGLEDDATVSIEVIAVNDEPVVSDINKSGDEDTVISFTNTDFEDAYTDPEDSALLKIQIVSLPSASTGILKLNGSLVSENDEISIGQVNNLKFEPVENFVGNSSFDWNGSDGELYAQNAASVNLTFNPINDEPIAQADSYTYLEGSSNSEDQSTGVLSNDTDPDGDELSAILVTNVSNGTLVFNSDGSFDYDHDGSETTSDQFTYKVNDGTVDGNTVSVSLTITPVNDPPVAVADNYSFDRGSSNSLSAAQGVLANDLDPENDDLSAILVSDVSNGTLSLNSDGSFDYTHDNSATTSDEFSYKVNDGTVDGNAVVVSLSIVEVNPSLVTVDDNYTFDEGSANAVAQSNGLLINDEDNIGSGITAQLVREPSDGTLTLNSDGSFSYTHNGSETMSDSFQYRITNGTDFGNSATVSLTISPVNDAPVAVADSYEIEEGSSNSIGSGEGVLANDSDAEGNSLIAVLVSDVSNGVLVLNSDGSFTYDHNGSETTSDSFTYKVNDGIEDGNTVSVSFIINLTNDPPVSVSDNYTFNEGSFNIITEASGVLSNDSDVDSDDLTAELVDDVKNGDLTLYADGSFEYTHDGSETNADSFSYQANDGNNSGNAVLVNLTITPANDLPVATPDTYTYDEGSSNSESATTGVLANDSDPEGDALTAILVEDVSNGFLVLNADGSFDYTHDGSETTSDSFRYKVNDGEDGNTVTVSLTIVPQNDPPFADNDSAILNEGAAVSINIIDGDSDSDGSLDLNSIEIESTVSNGSVTIQENGSITYVHNGSETTSDSFTYTIKDDLGASSNVASVSITVNPVNDPPITVADAIVVDEGGTTSTLINGTDNLLLNDSDPENDDITAVLVDDVAHGAIMVNPDGTFTYIHDGSNTISDQFTYVANDGENGNVATVSIDINPVNMPPVADDEMVDVVEGSSKVVDVTNGDYDPDGTIVKSSIALESFPTHGMVTINNNGSITYAHDGSETLNDSFGYTVLDNEGAVSNVATVEINVIPVNDLPLAEDDAAVVKEGEQVVIDLIRNDSDVDGFIEVGSVEIRQPPAHGELITNSDGTVTYSHDDSETEMDRFTYTVMDHLGGISNEATVTVLITAVEDAIDIPDTFTPNGDGVNDVWIIPEIDQYPNNVVKVFNRWGNKILEIEGYDNNTKVWSSQTDTRLTLGDDEVPSGTYFYVISLDYNRRPVSGFIVVNR